MEQNTYTENKKFFSNLGLRLFISMLVMYGIQLLALSIFEAIGAKVPSIGENINIRFLATMVPMYIIACPIILAIMKTMPSTQRIKSGKMKFSQMLVAFLILYASTYVCNILGNIVTSIIGMFKQNAVSNAIVDLTGSLHPAVTFFIMVICAPIVEELIFRKTLLSKTIPYGEGVSVVLSGLVFALYHGNLNQFAYTFLMGCFLGFIYLKTGRVVYTIILHMLLNFMGSVISVFILEISGFLELSAATANGATQAELTDIMTAHAAGMIAYFAYVVCLIGFVIAGIILFVVNRKKFTLASGEITIEKGQRFKTIFCNIGMVLFCIFGIALIIFQLLQ